MSDSKELKMSGTYLIKGITKHSLIILGPDGKRISVDIGTNTEWLNTEKLGTEVKASLILDSCGRYVLGGIVQQGALLTRYREEVMRVELEQTPPIEWLDYKVSIQIEAEQRCTI